MQRSTRDKKAILKYFQASASANLPKKVEIGNCEVLELSETAGLFTGQDTFSQTKDGKTIETAARYTRIGANRLGGYR